MYYKKNKNNFFEKFKYIRITLILIFLVISFLLGAYAHKTHFFYTFIKPTIYQNFNFLKKIVVGKFHNVEKVYLDIEFETLQELNNRRKIFIQNQEIDQELNEWLSVSIRYNDEKFRSKIRFKGRIIDNHLNPTMRNENISYKVKIKKSEEGNILGMREFNLMDLRRRGYLLEWYARTFLKNEGLIYLDYKFINLFINGKDHGIYALDEVISESTLTRNKRRDSVSVRIDNNFINAKTDLSITNPNDFGGYDNDYIINEIDTLNETIGNKKKELSNLNIFNQNFPINIKENIVLKPDDQRLKNFYIASSLLDNFRKGLLKTEEVFDLDQLAKGFAASDILDGWHGITWTNMSFYFNPISLKLEPIFQDWYNEGSVSTGDEKIDRDIRFLDVYNYGIFYKNIFSSIKFLERYIYFLEKYSNLKYFENFNKKIEDQLNNNLKSIYKSSPYYEFPYYLFERKIKKVQGFLYHYDPIYLSLHLVSKNSSNDSNTIIEMGNKHILPISINKIIFENFDGKILNKSTKINLKPRNLKKFTYNKFEESPVKFELFEIATKSFQKFKSITVEYKIIGSDKILSKKISNPIENKESTDVNFKNFLITENNYSILEIDQFIDQVGDQYIMKKGTWIIYDDFIIPKNKRLIIPPGTEIILINNAQIISKSPIIAKGTLLEKIFIKSFSPNSVLEDGNEKLKNILKDYLSDKNKLIIENNNLLPGQCIIISDAKETSIFENVIFDNLRNCEKGIVSSEGALNTYKTKIKMKNITFKNNSKGDDGINIIDSEFNLEDINLENINADGLDLDYSVGKIKNFSCKICFNDAIDISNTTLYLENFKAFDVYDKALSIGEYSRFYAEGVDIEKANIGLAVKDGSFAKVDNIQIKASKFPITTYIKKKEFGPAKIELNTLYLIQNLNPIFIEEGTELKIEDEGIDKLIKKNLYNTLYPDAEYRNTL